MLDLNGKVSQGGKKAGIQRVPPLGGSERSVGHLRGVLKSSQGEVCSDCFTSDKLDSERCDLSKVSQLVSGRAGILDGVRLFRGVWPHPTSYQLRNGSTLNMRSRWY